MSTVTIPVLLAVDWIMKTTTADKNKGIQWTPWTQLDDLDFADDLALLSHNKQQMQAKTTELDTISAQTGLHIHKDKTKIMKINTTSNDPIVLRGDNPLQEVDTSPTLVASSAGKVAPMRTFKPGSRKREPHLSC